MAGLVVKALVLLQQFQKGRDAGDEQQVGAQNHQQHRHEKVEQRLQGRGDGHRHVVARPQQQGTQHRQNPVGFGLFFSRFPAVEQLDGLGELYLEQVVAQGQQENGPEQDQRGGDSGQRHQKGYGHGSSQHQPQNPEHGPGKDHPQPQAQGQGQDRGEKGFPEQQVGNVPLFHAQNVVKPQLLFPALDDEAVGVKQKQHRKQGDDKLAQAEHGSHGGAPVHGFLVNAPDQSADGVKHKDDPRRGEQVGQVDPAVVFQVGKGQLPVEAHSPLTHERPRSFPGCRRKAEPASGRWPGTGRRRTWFPGRSGGTPGRP